MKKIKSIPTKEQKKEFVEKKVKEIRKQMFKIVDSPTKEESDALIKKAKEKVY